MLVKPKHNVNFTHRQLTVSTVDAAKLLKVQTLNLWKSVKPHIHLVILISVLYISCSTIIG